MQIRIYRKRSPVVEAYQHEGDPVIVVTLEGETRADPGDWIVKEPNGGCKRYKSADFQRIYEEIQ